MLKLITTIPNQFKLAFSGGIDSLVAAHFFRRRKGMTLCHFNHGCEYSDQIEAECIEKAKELELPIVIGRIRGKRKAKQSLEDYWRRERYRFLYEEYGNAVVTMHHLNDAVESWVWSSMHGESKLIQPEQYIEHNGKSNWLIRPFLATSKNDIREYAKNHGLTPVDDPYNNELDLTRNFIRAKVMPLIVEGINPGIETVIRKKYLNMK